MARRKEKPDKTPAQERAEIGTPAGESAEKGRKRHGTECMTSVCETDKIRSRREIADEEEISEEEFAEEGREISTIGGITGTKVRGGIPAGGETIGGTLGEPRRRGKPAQGNR